MGKYKHLDFVKAEVRDGTRESEWMWVLVDDSDDEQRIVFGRLDMAVPRCRKTGVVYAVEWIRNDGGFWKVGASSNEKAPHPVTNHIGEFLAASSRKLTKLREGKADADATGRDAG